MALNSASTTKIIGIILMVVGIGLAIWGYQLSESLGSQITQAVSGSETDQVMMFYISGAVGFVVGLYLVGKK